MRISLCILLVTVALAVTPSLSHAAKTHKVKKSETLASLARKYHVSIDDLKKTNNLVSTQVKKGDILVIPPRKSAPEVATADQSMTSTYKVKRGDSLIRIAKKTGVSVADLKRINNLGNRKVKLGQVLALNDDAADRPGNTKARVAKRYTLRHPELFNEKDYAESLDDLTAENAGDGSKSISGPITDNVKELKTAAYGFLGTRYRFGGNTRSGLDCSAFVQQVFRELEVSLPRSAREQFEVGNVVSPGDLKKGDLVFFRTYASFPSHVGIYLGDNRMIHASSRDRRVVISSLKSNYYRSRYLGAKRISKINPDFFSFDDLLHGIEEESMDDAVKNDSLGISQNN